jgi:hypothetical protein
MVNLTLSKYFIVALTIIFDLYNQLEDNEKQIQKKSTVIFLGHVVATKK